MYIARIVCAEHNFAIEQIADPAAELASLRRIVIQEFRCAFILAHAYMSVIGGDRDNAIVANLMNVLGGTEKSGIYLGNGFGDR